MFCAKTVDIRLFKEGTCFAYSVITQNILEERTSL